MISLQYIAIFRLNPMCFLAASVKKKKSQPLWSSVQCLCMRLCFFWVKFWTWPPWRTAVLAGCGCAGWTGRCLGLGGGIPVRQPLLELIGLRCPCGFSHVHSRHLAGAWTKRKMGRDLEFVREANCWNLQKAGKGWVGVWLQGGLGAFWFLLQFLLNMSKYFPHVCIFLIALVKSFIVQELFDMYI